MVGEKTKKQTAREITEKYEIKKYYTFLDDKNQIICKLCPNNCVIAENKSGLCCTRINSEGKFYSVVYGRPCSLHIDPIEKKPLYQYYPGEGILSLGTFGCNLFCKGCQNFDITRADAISSVKHLKYYTPEEIVDTAIENDIKLIAYTYNEPTIFFEYMIDIAKLAKKKGIKNVIVSNGYINPEPLKELCKYIDAANIDIKGITPEFYREYSKANIKPVLETIKTLHKNKVWLELTNLIIPGLNDDPKDIKKLCEWIKKNVGENVPLHFSRFYPHHQASKIIPTSTSTLDYAKQIAEEYGIKYIYIGNVGLLDNTYCSKCKSLLISRSYTDVDMRDLHGPNKNKCSCGAILPGMFK